MKKILTALVAIAIGVCIIAPSQNAEAQIYSNRCCTPVGACFLSASGPVGTPCWCNVPGGTVNGNLC